VRAAARIAVVATHSANARQQATERLIVKGANHGTCCCTLCTFGSTQRQREIAERASDKKDDRRGRDAIEQHGACCCTHRQHETASYKKDNREGDEVGRSACLLHASHVALHTAPTRDSKLQKG
jgi:hypothetical protein